jgi:dCMP deaminase
MKSKWHIRFMDLSESIASWSKDRSTKVGCVIVDSKRNILATGYNGFPRGIDDDIEARHERPMKYMWVEHSERNAIYSAARNGIKLEGSTIYVPWFPCTDCARGIIQSGISTIIAKKGDMDNSRWKDSFSCSLEMIEESDVELLWYEDLLEDNE